MRFLPSDPVTPADSTMRILFSLLVAAASAAADDSPAFYRGLNLNGPPVAIDGNRWDGDGSKGFVTKAKAFEAQAVSLDPAADSERAKMIRSSRWGEVDLRLQQVPAGVYAVFVYVWEDNNPETFSISLNGREVVSRHNSGTQGHWDKLGPWEVTVRDGEIKITSQGGAANFSGIEVWRGAEGRVTNPNPEDVAFFEKRIRPLLVKHCYECHSADSDEVAGNLLLDSRDGALKGGDGGPAVVPRDVQKSLLIEAVHYGEELQMPPDGQLSKQEIADLETWVKMGAPDPRDEYTDLATIKQRARLEQAREFWSLKPVGTPPLPEVQNKSWTQNEIDYFILAQLEQRGLQPVANADKRTLIRRATFDLTGLPPTPEEIDEFLADESPKAFERVVNRLLESPQYGERWGRHWMDLVRYADTAGDNSDYPIPQVYLYRNYIINSLNSDKPYDQFVREQIAGDLLPRKTDEQVIATGYLASSRRFGSVTKDYPQHLTIEDTIDNLGRTFLGLTISCSRCHDHKFDPISQQDYYGLYGIFESTKYPFPGIELDKKPRDFVSLKGGQLAYAVSDGKIGDARLHRKGDPKNAGDTVARKFLDVLGGDKLSPGSKSSGRLELAQWLTDPKNPLTARVMVNRIWQQHFGAGLVKTPSDFGSRGLPPTHPELLDWLARRFMDNGWSLKQLHRLIMASHAYQLSSFDNAANLAVDPNNDYHWKFQRRRLDAESLRDAMLAISGKLDRSMMTEPHPFPPVDKWQFTQHHPFRDSYPSNRRSIFLMTTRLNALPFFTAFDGPDRNATTSVRDNSVTPIQALYLLNDEFLHEQAAGLAERLVHERDDYPSRLQFAFELTLGRPPTNDDAKNASDYLTRLREMLSTSEIPADQHAQMMWQSYARVLLRANEFLYVD